VAGQRRVAAEVGKPSIGRPLPPRPRRESARRQVFGRRRDGGPARFRLGRTPGDRQAIGAVFVASCCTAADHQPTLAADRTHGHLLRGAGAVEAIVRGRSRAGRTPSRQRPHVAHHTSKTGRFGKAPSRHRADPACVGDWQGRGLSPGRNKFAIKWLCRARQRTAHDPTHRREPSLPISYTKPSR